MRNRSECQNHRKSLGVFSRAALLSTSAMIGLFVSSAAFAGDLTGVVTLPDSGQPVEGAIVLAVGQDGQTRRTVSGSRGQYRFEDLTPGRYDVTASLVGFEDVSRAVVIDDGDSEQDIVFFQGDVIIVQGTRSAQSNALSQQRAADNTSNVVSSDYLGKFPDNTVAEGLRRVPGISFQRQERTGDGQFISIRGLDAGLNNIQVNGQNAAVTGDDRRVSLDVFGADSISKITVAKTLLPFHEGEGIGGSVNLETKTPFEIGGNRLNVAGDVFHNDFRNKLGYKAGGSIVHKFGDDERIGILIAGAHSVRHLRNIEVDVLSSGSFPEVLPAGFEVQEDIPDQTLFPFDSGFNILRPEDIRYNKFDTDIKNTNVTAAIDLQATDNTVLSLIGTYNRRNQEHSRDTVGYEQSDAYSEVFVDALGENRFVYDPTGQNVRLRRQREASIRESTALVFQGETEFESWKFNYRAGYAYGVDNVPLDDQIEYRFRGLRDAAFLPLNPLTGNPIVRFDISTPELSSPEITPTGIAAALDPSNFTFAGGELQRFQSENERISGQFDIVKSFEGNVLKFVQFGGKYETSERLETFTEPFDAGNENGLALLDSGLQIGGQDFVELGDGALTSIPTFLRIIDRDIAGALFRLESEGLIDNERSPDEMTLVNEDVFAGYAMAKVQFGNIDIIGGVRVEHTWVDADTAQLIDLNFLASPNVSRESRTVQSSAYTTVLPRVQVNYRPSENLIFRGAVFTSLARPEPDAIAQALEIEFEEISGEDNELFIAFGNPALRPAYSTNFDLGVEWYTGKIGIISANVFYKTISRFIYDDVAPGGAATIDDVDLSDVPELTPFLSQPLDVEFTQPINGGTAEVYGVELNFVRQFTELPGALSGLGALANVTFQKSETDIDPFGFGNRKIEFFNAPSYIGSVGLNYTAYNFDAAVTYSFQDRQIDTADRFGLDEYEQPFQSLDLVIKYDLSELTGVDMGIALRASDILDGGTKPHNYETRGSGPQFLDDSGFNGRTIQLGVSATF